MTKLILGVAVFAALVTFVGFKSILASGEVAAAPHDGMTINATEFDSRAPHGLPIVTADLS